MFRCPSCAAFNVQVTFGPSAGNAPEPRGRGRCVECGTTWAQGRRASECSDVVLAHELEPEAASGDLTAA